MHTLSKDELLWVNGGAKINIDELKQKVSKLGSKGKEKLFAAGRGVYKALLWAANFYGKYCGNPPIDDDDNNCMADECFEQRDDGV